MAEVNTLNAPTVGTMRSFEHVSLSLKSDNSSIENSPVDTTLPVQTAISSLFGTETEAESFKHSSVPDGIESIFVESNFSDTLPLVSSEGHTQWLINISQNSGLTSSYVDISEINSSAIVYVDAPAFELPYSKILIICFLSLIIICAIIGNVLVCVAIFTERSLRKTSNYFYVSLALADLLVSSVVMTFAVANDMMGHWIFGPIFCDIWLSSDVMCSTASILNICAISLDRFLHIKNPYHYENTMTTKRTLLFIATLWILSGLISFLPIHLDLHKTENHDPYVGKVFICLLELNPIYAVCSSVISFFVPCIIMIAIYVKLYQYARKHVKDIKRTSTWSAQSAAILDPSVQQASMYKASDHKAAVTLGVIMGTFLFCWMPFFTINVTGAFCSCVPPLLFNALTWLGYINSMANPIIYPVFNKDFRTAFKRILSFPACRNRCCSNTCCRTKNTNKNLRSTSNNSNLFTRYQFKSPSNNGHSATFSSDVTMATDRSDYTLNTSRSNSHMEGFIKKRENIPESKSLISSPMSPKLNSVDKITVV